MTDREPRDEVRREPSKPAFDDDAMSASQAAFEADLSALHADDALLDALGGSDPQVADGLGDQELNALLLAWRRDIDSEPLAELVDTDTAVTTVKAAALAQKHQRRPRRMRLLVPVAAAAAVLAITFTGTSVAARDAQPGDTLWGLTKVLYADHARSVEAASAARTDLQQASIALSQGRIAEAQHALAEAAAKLTQVSVEDNLDQLMQEHKQLSAMLQNPDTTTPSTTTTPATSSSAPTSSSPAPSPSSTPTSASEPPSSTTPTPPSSTTTSPPTTSSSSAAAEGTGSGGSTVRYDTTDSGTGTGAGAGGQAPAATGGN
ncbi:MAG TPA: anti-sigma-D factor RsdA [Amycolatopsis sp.]|nr:anti-sigma-D factor RsdA [Amycolatopsis sp.]